MGCKGCYKADSVDPNFFPFSTFVSVHVCLHVCGCYMFACTHALGGPRRIQESSWLSFLPLFTKAEFLNWTQSLLIWLGSSCSEDPWLHLPRLYHKSSTPNWHCINGTDSGPKGSQNLHRKGKLGVCLSQPFTNDHANCITSKPLCPRK